MCMHTTKHVRRERTKMIDPASMTDWTLAVVLAGLLGAVAVTGAATLRKELEAGAR